MTHTRPHPPTLNVRRRRGRTSILIADWTVQELQADLERQRRILQNVALIEARDKAEAALIAAQQAPAQHIQAPAHRASEPSTAEAIEAQEPLSEAAQTATSSTPVQSPKIMTRKTEEPSPSPWKPPPPDEPHSWQPKVSVKRGG